MGRRRTSFDDQEIVVLPRAIRGIDELRVHDIIQEDDLRTGR
jgi:hypothetical protein